MAGLIPQGFIENLRERTDLAELIGARITLKKAGSNYKACCPFHDERTPSFNVRPDKGFYHCFGCGAHGDAIAFLQEYENLSFTEAVESLAAHLGMDVPYDESAKENMRKAQSLTGALEQASHFYRQCLQQHPSGSLARDYLQHRGVDAETAERFGIGYAPPEGDALVRHVDKETLDALIAVKAVTDRYERPRDLFRNRLMFPIRNGRGRTVAFGGRTLGDDKAKYLNSPETPLFHKSDHMYGLYEARQALRDLPRLLVVEGYMDVISLAQHGFANVVATLGTATTQSHLTTLFRHTEEVVFCFDGDAAGVRAARKALDQSLPVMRGARRVRFLFVPEGEDPDSMVRGEDGQQRFQTAIDAARPASVVLLDALTENLSLDSPDGRATLIEKARPYVNALPPEAFRTELIGELAGLARLPADDLRALYAATPSPTRPAVDKVFSTKKTRVMPVSRALSLLFADTALAHNAAQPDDLRESDTPGAAILADAIEFFASTPNVSVSQWLERYREHRFFQRLQELAATTPPGDEASRAREFDEALVHLNTKTASQASLRQRYNALIARQAHEPLDPDSAQELKDIHHKLRSFRRDQA